MDEETQAIQGLNRTLDRLRRPRVGKLEVAIAVAGVVVLVAAFLSIWFIFGELRHQADRDAQAARDRRAQALVGSDVKDLALELRKAVAGLSAAQREAAAEILAGIEELLNRQTQVIVREEARRDTVVIVFSPQPQPTATVTCDPRPVIGNCRRR